MSSPITVKRMTGLHDLPIETILEISKHMDLQTIARFSRTCQNMHNILRPSLVKIAKSSAQGDAKRLKQCEWLSTSIAEDINIQTTLKVRHWQYLNFRQPLADAITEGKLDAVRFFLEAGVSPNVQDAFGLSMVVVAALSNRLDIIFLLLKYGADLAFSHRDAEFITNLLVGCCHLETIQLLMAHGADIFLKVDDESALCMLDSMMENDDVRVLGLVLHHYPELVSGAQIPNDTVISVAVAQPNRRRRYAMMAMLLAAGIDINVRLMSGKTLLHSVCEHCLPDDLDLVNMLLERGIRTDIKADRGMTELHYAVGTGNSLKVVRVLLSHGTFNVNAATDSGLTPLHLAVARKDPCYVRVLVEHGADINLGNKMGQMPIELAIGMGWDGLEAYLNAVYSK
ncbi:ankyrin repeat-containing domain protein [Aspergillus avenaceus]|uniref:Ankyrin repeat-containing domain protein n=1 Tax=Aspergillus avenaceus TaxID=36643 RepID=A0A5N6TJB9_ASPAV|nr:ankyrin repeat-containing domain protein [Aspergillus avenaceus]